MPLFANPEVRFRLRVFQYGIKQGIADKAQGWRISDGAVYWMMVPPRDKQSTADTPNKSPTMPNTPDWHLITTILSAPVKSQRSYVNVFMLGYRFGLNHSLYTDGLIGGLTAGGTAFLLIIVMRWRKRQSILMHK